MANHLGEPVDLVLMANTFHGVPDQTRLAGGIRKVLRPERVFAVVNWHSLPREKTIVLGQPRGPATGLRMAPAAVGAAVAPAGFRIARIVELPPYHYGILLTLGGTRP